VSDKVYVAVPDEDHRRQNKCTVCGFAFSLKKGERPLRLCPYCQGAMETYYIAREAVLVR
jgi:hypothetical protein